MYRAGINTIMLFFWHPFVWGYMRWSADIFWYKVEHIFCLHNAVTRIFSCSWYKFVQWKSMFDNIVWILRYLHNNMHKGDPGIIDFSSSLIIFLLWETDKLKVGRRSGNTYMVLVFESATLKILCLELEFSSMWNLDD